MIISSHFQLTNQVTEGHCNRLNSATRVTKASLSLFEVGFLALPSTFIIFILVAQAFFFSFITVYFWLDTARASSSFITCFFWLALCDLAFTFYICLAQACSLAATLLSSFSLLLLSSTSLVRNLYVLTMRMKTRLDIIPEELFVNTKTHQQSPFRIIISSMVGSESKSFEILIRAFPDRT